MHVYVARQSPGPKPEATVQVGVPIRRQRARAAKVLQVAYDEKNGQAAAQKAEVVQNNTPQVASADAGGATGTAPTPAGSSDISSPAASPSNAPDSLAC